MYYIKAVEEMLIGASKSGSALEHELYSIVKEVRTKGSCERKFVIMNNAYFRFFKNFSDDWENELKKFTDYFELKLKISMDGNLIEFHR